MKKAFKSIIETIQKRPVRFAFLCEAVLVLLLAFGINLSGVQIGAILGVVNSVLALWLDNYTTPVDANNVPLNPYYFAAPEATGN